MKRILSLLLCFISLFSIGFTPVLATETINESDAPLVGYDPSVNAYAAIVLDMETGNVLYEYDADEQNYPASCTKIMTAYLCLKYGDINDTVTISEMAFSDLSAQASTWNFEIGEEMTVHQVLKCLLVVSASEAANVVAEYISGSIEEFVELMNEEAANLGLENTHFVNCHGLPRSQHYTTARDLATIAMAAMEYGIFREIVGSSITKLEATNYHNATQILTTNGLLPGSTEYKGKYNYPYAIGIKTGHTSVAGYNLVSAANKDGTEILTVVMGCGSRESSFAQTVKLFDWTFENYETLTWDWEPHTSEEAPELPDAPEFEEIIPSIPEEPEEVEIIPAEEVPESVQEPQQSPTESPAPEVNDKPEPSQNTMTLMEKLQASGYLPAVICFSIALILLLILLVVLIIIVSRMHKSKKAAKRKQRR